MGLPKGLARLLQVPATYLRHVAPDQWGNTITGTPFAVKCFVDEENAEYGEAQVGDTVSSTPTVTVPIYIDALDPFPTIEDIIDVEGRVRIVTNVSTIRNKKGVPQLHILQTTTK